MKCSGRVIARQWPLGEVRAEGEALGILHWMGLQQRAKERESSMRKITEERQKRGDLIFFCVKEKEKKKNIQHQFYITRLVMCIQTDRIVDDIEKFDLFSQSCNIYPFVLWS